MEENIPKIEFEPGGPRKDCPNKMKCLTMSAPNQTEKFMIHQNCAISTMLQEILKETRKAK
jgi:hypothetical protein